MELVIKGPRVSGKILKGGIKIHFSHVGGINAHSSVGESKEPEGGERINLVTAGCIMMKRKIIFVDSC